MPATGWCAIASRLKNREKNLAQLIAADPQLARRHAILTRIDGLGTLTANQLIAAGKPAKIAITAVMRKLIVTTNVLLKADRLWVKALA
jgi:hypothetical protein